MDERRGQRNQEAQDEIAGLEPEDHAMAALGYGEGTEQVVADEDFVLLFDGQGC